jgi:hypothetical protein
MFRRSNTDSAMSAAIRILTSVLASRSWAGGDVVDGWPIPSSPSWPLGHAFCCLAPTYVFPEKEEHRNRNYSVVLELESFLGNCPVDPLVRRDHMFRQFVEAHGDSNAGGSESDGEETRKKKEKKEKKQKKEKKKEEKKRKRTSRDVDSEPAKR